MMFCITDYLVLPENNQKKEGRQTHIYDIHQRVPTGDPRARSGPRRYLLIC